MTTDERNIIVREELKFSTDLLKLSTLVDATHGLRGLGKYPTYDRLNDVLINVIATLFSDQKHFYLRFKVDIENDSEGPVVALDADSSQTNDTRVFRYVLGRERFIRKLREINHEVLKFACSKSYDEISGFWRINDIGLGDHSATLSVLFDVIHTLPKEIGHIKYPAIKESLKEANINRINELVDNEALAICSADKYASELKDLASIIGDPKKVLKLFMIQKFNADELKEQNARLVLEYERLFDEYEQAVKTILNLTHDNRVMHEVDCKRNKEAEMLLAANKDIAADHSPKTYDESTQTDCEPEMDEYEYGYTTNETKQMNEPDSGFYELSELDHTYTGSSPNSPSSTIPSEPLISNASESPIPPNILPSIIGRSDNIKVSPTVEVEFEKWSSEEDDVQLSSSQLEGFDQQTQETTQILGYMAKSNYLLIPLVVLFVLFLLSGASLCVIAHFGWIPIIINAIFDGPMTLQLGYSNGCPPF